jgi:hypothetical protein
MRKILIFLFSCLPLGQAFGQTRLPDSTQVEIHSGVSDPALQDLLSASNVNYFRLVCKDSLLRGQPFYLIAKEYKYKKLHSTDTVFRQVPVAYLGSGKKDKKMEIRLLARYRNLDTVEMHLRYPSVSTRKIYSTLAKDTYSLRDALNSHGDPVRVAVGRPVPVWVYSLPYEDPKKPGYLFYCELTAKGVPPEKWGEHYGVQHYLIFELFIGPWPVAK